jgi:hypothetical protein
MYFVLIPDLKVSVGLGDVGVSLTGRRVRAQAPHTATALPTLHLSTSILMLKKEKGKTGRLFASSILQGLKGLCHEMNNFLEGLKNQIRTFCIFAGSFYIF